MSNLRYGLRTYLRAPGFTLAAVIVLALGIGATTAIFTLVKSLLLEPLAYPDSGRLMWISRVPPRNSAGVSELSGGDFLEIRRQTRVFEKVACFFRGSWNVTGVGEPQRLAGARVSEGFFETLGVRPIHGRVFLPDEHQTGREMVVIFSYGFWQQRFGGDPSAVGRHVTLDGIPYEVVGIMPPDFPLATEYDMWAPLQRDSAYANSDRVRVFRMIGRLKKGVRPEQTHAEETALAVILAQRNPLSRGYSVKVETFADQEVSGVRHTLWIFAAAVGCVLLISCSNVASLMLARGAARVREMAVRAAVGASRAALVRQLLVESALLAMAGGALGYPLAVEGVRFLVALDPTAFPRAQEIHADWGVLGFAFLLSLMTGLVFGIVPALRGSGVNLRDALKDGGRGGTAGRRGTSLRSTLVVIEVALGVVLMASAGLLARSFRALTELRRGYDIRNVLTMQMALTGTRYRDMSECERFLARLIPQVEQIPGVEAVGSTNNLPLSTDRYMASAWLDTQPVHTRETRIVLDYRIVTPGYFRAMGVPLLSGRFFEWTDGPVAPKVAIVNEAFARQFFTRGGALGRRVTLSTDPPLVEEIVGVVGSFRERSLTEEPRGEIFTVLTQTPMNWQTLVVRSSSDPAGLSAAVRSVIASVDRDVPVFNVHTMEEQVNQSLAQPRLRGALLAVFSVVALVLASLGIYGVIACAVAERRQEIGIRLALGARQHEVRRMVVTQGLKLTLAGLGVGLIGAIGATRLLQSFLFGVGPGDPLTFVGTICVFLAVALAASYLPARRATRVDPIKVLREE